MDKISSWIRQSRHRAKKYGVINSLTIEEVNDLLNKFEELCAYCGKASHTLDHPFPLNDNAPNAAANVLPCCHACKTLKGTTDLVAFYNAGHIKKREYIALLKGMLQRNGGDVLKEHIKGITGINA